MAAAKSAPARVGEALKFEGHDAAPDLLHLAATRIEDGDCVCRLTLVLAPEAAS